MRRQSKTGDASRHGDDAGQLKQTEMPTSHVVEHGEGVTMTTNNDVSASSSVEYASLCGSMDTLHTAVDN